MTQHIIFLKKYIVEHKNTIIMFVLFYIVFGCILGLSNISIATLSYAYVVWTFLCLVIGIIDMFKSYTKHKARLDIVNHIDLGDCDMPIASNMLEEDYQNMIGNLQKINKQEYAELNDKYVSLVNYTTLWAHQIKTPITALELLIQEMDDITDFKVKECKEKVFEIEKYVDITLQYMRFDSANGDYVLKDTDLDVAVKECIKYFRRTFISKKIGINYDTIEENVVTDSKWLVFVIKQILSNSLKYTTEGSVSIYSDEVIEEDGNIKKTLIIEDTGIGIAPEDLPRIFDRAYTGYNGHMYKKATGIGLYISRQVLEELGHKLEIESTIGKGTIARIAF